MNGNMCDSLFLEITILVFELYKNLVFNPSIRNSMVCLGGTHYENLLMQYIEIFN